MRSSILRVARISYFETLEIAHHLSGRTRSKIVAIYWAHRDHKADLKGSYD
jgi:hypothetical protein